MPFEQVQVAVDLVDQVDVLRQQEKSADPAGAETAGAAGRLVVDVGRGHHGNGSLRDGRVIEPLLNSPSTLLEKSLLASRPFLSESSTHSKASLFWNSEDVILPTLFQRPVGFSSPFSKNLNTRGINHACFGSREKPGTVRHIARGAECH